MIGAHTGLLWPAIYNRRSGGGPPPNDWILATGFWNDAGVWYDSATWMDGP